MCLNFPTNSKCRDWCGSWFLDRIPLWCCWLLHVVGLGCWIGYSSSSKNNSCIGLVWFSSTVRLAGFWLNHSCHGSGPSSNFGRTFTTLCLDREKIRKWLGNPWHFWYTFDLFLELRINMYYTLLYIVNTNSLYIFRHMMYMYIYIYIHITYIYIYIHNTCIYIIYLWLYHDKSWCRRGEAERGEAPSPPTELIQALSRAREEREERPQRDHLRQFWGDFWALSIFGSPRNWDKVKDVKG